MGGWFKSSLRYSNFIKRIVEKTLNREQFPERKIPSKKRVLLHSLQKERLKMVKEPGFCLHKRTGQAYVRFGGKPFCLGEFSSGVKKERYNRLKAEIRRKSAFCEV